MTHRLLVGRAPKGLRILVFPTQAFAQCESVIVSVPLGGERPTARRWTQARRLD
jgi:hypothetical protein